jgi:hypothetical protein
LFSQHNSERAIYLEYYGDKNNNKTPDIDEIGVQYLKGDGDFRSAESIALLQASRYCGDQPALFTLSGICSPAD